MVTSRLREKHGARDRRGLRLLSSPVLTSKNGRFQNDSTFTTSWVDRIGIHCLCPCLGVGYLLAKFIQGVPQKMKKCMHLKKTKPHWKRKPPKVITWKERIEAERRERQRRVLSDPFNLGRTMAMAAMSGLIFPMEALRELNKK